MTNIIKQNINLSDYPYPRIYLAGPEVFLPDPITAGNLKKELCNKYGFEGIFPIDAELNLNNLSPRETGLEICKANEELIASCQILIANMTPFRGPSADVGTVYEMGVARGLGLIIFAYTNILTKYTKRIENFYNNSLKRDKNGRLRDKNGMALEEWGLIDNLMLDGCVYSSNGMLIVEEAPKDEIFTYLGGFEKCLKHARQL